MKKYVKLEPDQFDIGPVAMRFWRSVGPEKATGCMDFTGTQDKDGYGKFTIFNSCFRAHRVAYYLYYGVLSDLQVNHICDNPVCCNPCHLWQGTQQDNACDCVLKDRHSQAKLTIQQVLEIYNLVHTGISKKALATKYNVSYCTIHAIQHKRSWKSVLGDK